MTYEEITAIAPKTSGIYKITNLINNKSYIGQSVDIKNRWRNHIRVFKNKEDKKYNYPLYSAFRKYGIENFDFEILEEVAPDDLDKKEIYYIEKYNTFHNGYNQTSGGSTPHGEEIGTSIYKEKDIIEIRKMYRDGKSFKEAVEKFPNINYHSLKSIWKGNSWAHIMKEIYFDEEVKNRQKENKSKNVRGEKCATSVLKNTQVKEIINLLEEGKLTNVEIAKIFKINVSTINAINNCQNWNWMHNYKNNIRKEANRDSFLSEDDVKKIIFTLENEPLNITLNEIANKLNISSSIIYNINNCTHWTSLHNYRNNIRKESHNINYDIRCGEGNKKSVYTEEQILKVIDLLINTEYPYDKIYELTKVKKSTIQSINNCRNWKHLHNFKNNIRKESHFTCSK